MEGRWKRRNKKKKKKKMEGQKKQEKKKSVVLPCVLIPVLLQTVTKPGCVLRSLSLSMWCQLNCPSLGDPD